MTAGAWARRASTCPSKERWPCLSIHHRAPSRRITRRPRHGAVRHIDAVSAWDFPMLALAEGDHDPQHRSAPSSGVACALAYQSSTSMTIRIMAFGFRRARCFVRAREPGRRGNRQRTTAVRTGLRHSPAVARRLLPQRRSISCSATYGSPDPQSPVSLPAPMRIINKPGEGTRTRLTASSSGVSTACAVLLSTASNRSTLRSLLRGATSGRRHHADHVSVELEWAGCR